ncbi:MAG: LamG domain-containing protein [Verrucomicrobiota bacterium]
MEIVVGTNPISVVALGRCLAAGNSGMHELKLVNAVDGTDVVGGSTTIAMGGGTVGQFQYAALSSPVGLAAGATYYVVSQETTGGDQWYDLNTLIATTGAAAQMAAVWSYGTGQWNLEGSPGQAYVPVDFQYTNPTLNSNLAAATRYVTGTTLGTLRNDFSGYVGMEIVVGTNPISVVALGRCLAAGNSGMHELKLVNAVDGTDVAGGSTTIAMGGGTVGQFQYAALSSPVTLAAGRTYYVASEETANGDQWYNNLNTEITTTGAAEQNGAVWGFGPGQWYATGSPGQTYVPVDFEYTNASYGANSVELGADYVTGTALGNVRNNFSGYVGMEIVVGTNPLSVVALGRCYAPGDSGVHVVKLVNGAAGTDVPQGNVTLAVAGGTAGQFQHAALSDPVTLAAGGTYYVVSEESAGGDPWYDLNTEVTTTGAATESAGVWGLGPGQWYVTGTPGQAYVPVDFQYSNSQSAASAPAVTSGLVAWYPLAGNPHDYSTNGYNGNFDGPPIPTNGVDGVPNTAMYFANNDMSVPDVLVQTNTSFSVSLWVQPSQLNDNYQALVDGGGFNVATSGWGFGFNNLNQLFIVCGSGYDESTFVLSPGVFYHVVVTAQTGSPYAFTFYVNGVEMASTSVATVNSWSQNAGITDFGRAVNGPPIYFTGAMADVRIYNRELSPAEVVTLYTNDSTRQVEPPSAITDPDLTYLKFLDDITASPQYSYIYWPAPLRDSSVVNNTNVLYYSNEGHEDDVWVSVNGVTAAGLHWHGVGGSYADTGDSNHFAFTTNSYTIALWVQPMTAYGTFLSCGVAGISGWCVNEDVNYNLFFNTYSNGVTSSVGSLPVYNNTFHAILISVSNGTNVAMYRDGMLFATGTVTVPAPAGTNTLMLGQQNLGTYFGRTLDGNMWMTQIWSTNLDAVQASYLYLNQVDGSPWPP